MDTQPLEEGQSEVGRILPEKMKALMYFSSSDFDRIGFNLDTILKLIKINNMQIEEGVWMKY